MKVFMNALWQDVRYGVRALGRNRGHTTVMVLTLALGIGANASIFSVVDGVLLQPLPYEGGDGLYRLVQSAPLADIDDAGVSVREFEDYRAMNRSLTGLVEYHALWFNLLDSGEPERVQAGVVSWNYFDVVGVEPIHGRTFSPDEDRVGAEPVLVLGNEFWRDRYGGDPDVVGRTVEMNDQIHTIVGVLPPLPAYPDENDVWMPWYACPFRSGEHWREDRDMRALTVLARSRPGVDGERAERDIARVAAALEAEHPESYPETAGFRATVVPLEEELTREARPTFLMLLGLAGFVLLIACANVANLTLARLSRRERELAVRAALGAGRARLTRQIVTESMLVAVVGGVLGVLLAVGLVDLLAEFSRRFTPLSHEVAVDGRVLGFSALLILATGLGVGLLPATAAGTRDISGTLREGSGGTSAARRQSRLRRALVTGQLAVSFALLIAAALMIRSFIELQSVDPGFDPDGVLTAQIDLDWTTYTDSELRRDFWDTLLPRLRATPGVRQAALASNFPLNGGTFSSPVGVEGETRPEGAPLPQTEVLLVSPGYFDALRIPLLEGRVFDERDHADAAPTVLVNRAMVRHRWGDRSPIGERITLSGLSWRVVGVVGDVKQEGLDEAFADQVYIPFARDPLLSTRVVLRTAAADPLGLSRAVTEAVHAIDPNQPVAFLQTLAEVRRDSIASPRLTMLLLTLFGAIALIISVAGILGLVAYAISQRTDEIGIRLALGAEPRAVRWMIVRDVLGLLGVGIGAGLAGTLVLVRLMRGMLFGIEPTDPGTFISTAALFALVVLGASYLQSARTSAISPMRVLRGE